MTRDEAQKAAEKMAADLGEGWTPEAFDLGELLGDSPDEECVAHAEKGILRVVALPYLPNSSRRFRAMMEFGDIQTAGSSPKEAVQRACDRAICKIGERIAYLNKERDELYALMRDLKNTKRGE